MKRVMLELLAWLKFLSFDEWRQCRYRSRMPRHRVPIETLPKKYEFGPEDDIVEKGCYEYVGQCTHLDEFLYFNGHMDENHPYYKTKKGYINPRIVMQ